MHQKSYSALFRDGDKNLFGLSTHAWGVIFLLSGSVFDAVDSVMLDVAGDEGVASNALVLYIAIGSFGGAILVDFVFYKFIGYNSKVGNGTVYWFVFSEIWNDIQREKLLSMPHYLWWFVLFGISNFSTDLFSIASYVFCDNIGDAIAIYDMYPVLIPIFGIFVRHRHKGFDWKHRFWICFFMIIIGLVLLNRPGFIFGYSSSVDAGRQALGCIFALLAALAAASYVVANTILQTMVDETRNGYFDQLFSEDTPLMISKTRSSSENGSDNENNNNHNKNNNNTDGNDNNSAQALSSLGGVSAGDGIDSIENNIDSTGVVIGDNSSDIGKGDISAIDYIIFNQIALVTVSIEYASLITIVLCILFCPLSLINGSWFWDEFVLFYEYMSDKALVYSIGGSIVWWFDYYFYTFGIFMLRDATLSGLLDVSDVFFAFVFSYVWLDETATVYDISGSALIVLSIIICVYPWEKHKNIPKWW